MSLVNQSNLETSAAAVTSDGETAIAAGDFVPVAIAANLEQRLGEMREAATLAVNARGTVAKEAALSRLAASLAITAPLPDAALSTVEPEQSTAIIGATVGITVTLIDAAGRPVPNRPVKIIATGSPTISNPMSTDSAGVAVFEVSGTTAETCAFTAIASGDAIEVTASVEIEFVAA